MRVERDKPTSDFRLPASLAARYHQRQATLIGQSDRAARRVAARYRRLASWLAARAAEAGYAGIPGLAEEVDRWLARTHQAVAEEFRRLARAGHRTSAAAILSSIPRSWLPVLLGMTTERATEAIDAPPGLEIDYPWEPIVQRAVSRDEAMQLIRAHLLPGPTAEEVEQWLTTPGPGGLTWDERLKYWEAPTRAAMLNELSIGLADEENVDGLRKRLTPLADGLAWKAQRIARTEGRRVAERAHQAAIDGLGEMVDGQQVVAVMDEWTRPEHAARNGRLYRRGADGTYRADDGEVLPDLPDAANCRCMAIPSLKMPEAFRKDPALRAQFETATGKLIPDPASYTDWWERASARERMTAVGAKRYQAVRDLVGREPQWSDFLAPDGSLMSVSDLRRESTADRSQRQRQVQAVLDARRRTFQAVASRGYSAGTGRARPEAIASTPFVRGGYPHQPILDALEMGDPREVTILAADRALVDALAMDLFRGSVDNRQLARLAGAVDRADVLVGIEQGGLRLETRRKDFRSLRWVGLDHAGILKVELVRMDVARRRQRQGLGTRSIARTVQQASKLGVQYADATAVRTKTEGGYYMLARCGFDAQLPRDWLKAHEGDLARLGMTPRRLSHLLNTPEGREFWRRHGRTLDVTMDLRPGSVEMFSFAEYLGHRRSEGRSMAESKQPKSGDEPPDFRELIPDYEPPKYPIYGAGLCFTEEDEEILDRVWAARPRTEEDDKRWEEFRRRIRPGTRAPFSEEDRRRLEERARALRLKSQAEKPAEEGS